MKKTLILATVSIAVGLLAVGVFSSSHAQVFQQQFPQEQLKPGIGGASATQDGKGLVNLNSKRRKTSSSRAGGIQSQPIRMLARDDSDPGSDFPVFPVVINDNLGLDAETQALYEQMAATLNGYAVVPNDRLNYYSAVNNPPNSIINNWGGVVENVQANCNGYLVTVSVGPSLSTASLGPATIILDSQYSEQYQVNNDNTFSYVGFLDPLGMTGQIPTSMIGL